MDPVSRSWLAHFRAGQGRSLLRLLPPFAPDLDAEVRSALVRSLQLFHLGEAGEGRVAGQARRAQDPALDEAMRQSVELYVKEEGRHARELVVALCALGAAPLQHATSERLFRHGRRLAGLRLKMLVIAGAEVVGVVFYELLRDSLERVDPRLGPIARLGATIAGEERAHLDFQRDYFARALRALPRAERGAASARLALGFTSIVGCAALTFTLDHRKLLAVLGVSAAEVARQCRRVAAQRMRQLPEAIELAGLGPARRELEQSVVCARTA